MANSMTITQKVPLEVEFLDSKGNPAKVDGVPEWATDNPSILSLTPTANGLGCMVAAVGMIGSATVQVTADADLGSGVEPVIGTALIDVGAGKASVANVKVGTPEEQ